MARRRQSRDGGGRGRQSAVRHLHGNERCGVGGARLDDVCVFRLDGHAARVSLQPCRSRDGRLGQCACVARDGFPQGRHGVHGDRLRSARLGLGRAICAGEDAPADDSRRRHGCTGARQHRAALPADHLAAYAVLCAASRAGDRKPRRRSAQDRGAHLVCGRRARHEREGDARAHPGSVGRAAGRVLRLHRSLAARRRLLLRSVATRGRTGRDASARGRADLGSC